MDDGSAKMVAQRGLPLDAQDKAIAELAETLEQLSARLNPILSPNMKDRASDPGEPDYDGSPIAGMIASNTRKIHALSHSVRTLMERIEL